MRTNFYETNDKLKEVMYKKFVYHLPGYLDVAIEKDQNQEIKPLTNAMDYFEYHYRNYLSGIHKTLHQVMKEIRNLKSQKGFKELIVDLILRSIENDILEYELYELMPRFIKAKQEVEKEISKNKTS